MHVRLSVGISVTFVGRRGALLESKPFDRRVVGSNPALAATYAPWASPSLTVACSALACKLRHSVIAVVGSASERLVLWEALQKWINTIQCKYSVLLGRLLLLCLCRSLCSWSTTICLPPPSPSPTPLLLLFPFSSSPSPTPPILLPILLLCVCFCASVSGSLFEIFPNCASSLDYRSMRPRHSLYLSFLPLQYRPGSQRRPSPQNQRCIFSPYFRFLPYFGTSFRIFENFPNWPFSQNNLSVYPPKFSMSFLVIYSRFCNFPHIFSKFIYTFPTISWKITSPYFYKRPSYFRSICVFFLIYVICFAYFDHYAVMHHAIHVLEAHAGSSGPQLTCIVLDYTIMLNCDRLDFYQIGLNCVICGAE